MPRGTLSGSLQRAGMWNSTCTIVTDEGGARDASGQRAPGPAPVSEALTDIPCRKASQVKGSSGDYEQERAFGIITLTGEVVFLNGHYPQITTRMQANVDGEVLDIEGVQHSSDNQFTLIAVEARS